MPVIDSVKRYALLHTEKHQKDRKRKEIPINKLFSYFTIDDRTSFITDS